MADTGVLYPASHAEVNYLGGGSGWNNRANSIGAPDGSYTYINLSAATYTRYLALTNYSFAIPAGATIDGIETDVYNIAEDDHINYLVCRLTKDATNPVGDDKWTSTAVPGSWTHKIDGGATDLWGTTWTATEINASTFGIMVVYSRDEGAGEGYIRVDSAGIKVYYTPSVAKKFMYYKRFR